MYELVIVWFDGTKNVFEYDTEDDAEQGGRNYKMAFGDQVQWYGVRQKF